MSVDSKNLENYKPNNSNFEYQKWPFYWIARTNNRYSQRMEIALKRAGVTITGWRVGMLLNIHGVLSISEISTHSAVKLSTVTRTVYGMQDKGLLTAKPRASDARVTEVTLTDQGRKLVDTVVSQTSGIFDQVLETISEDELEQLNDLLQRLFVNLSDR